MDSTEKKPLLDDNARSALHFAMLAAAMVLLIRFGGYLLAWFQRHRHPDELAEALRPFQHEYLLSAPHMVVGPDTDLAERLLLALLLALFIGILAGLAMGLVMHAVGRDGSRWAPLAGRIVLVITATWSVHAALFLPTQAWTWEPDGFHRMDRPNLMGRLALPGIAQRTALQFEDVRMDGDALLIITEEGTLRFEPADDGERSAAAVRLLKARYLPEPAGHQ